MGDPRGACRPTDCSILEGAVPLESTEFQTWAMGADFPRGPREGRCSRAPRPSARGVVPAPPQAAPGTRSALCSKQNTHVAEGCRGERVFNVCLIHVWLHSVEARHT